MPNLALFDFDGTITTNDNFTRFIFAAVEPRRMVVGMIALSPLVAAFRMGLLPASMMRAAVARFAFCGVQEGRVREAGTRYARDQIPKVLRPQALERLKWHKAQGDTVAVVSASLDVYLADWYQQNGLDLICTQLEARSGVLTGRYLGRDCCGKEKARRVRQRYNLGSFPVIYGYGDTGEDEEMLRLATVKYFRWREDQRTYASHLDQSE